MTTEAYKAAFAAGYTKEVSADCAAHTLTLLVNPTHDYDSRLRAFDVDENDYVTVNGWLWTFEDL